jgi:hypothetical protein
MGTLFSQSPRGEKLSNGFHHVRAALRFMEVPINRPPTPAEWSAACDLVRAALAVQSADVLDEQLAGFGSILERISDALRG